MRRFIGILGFVALAGAIGCASSTEIGEYEAALQQASSCEDVLGAIHLDAIAKVDLELKSFVEQEYYGWGRGGVAVDGDAEFAGAGGTGGPQPPSANEGDAADSPSGFSDTNRQVADVDEADIVKVGDEGRKLYVIRGNGFYEFDSWPAAQTSKVADVEIEGGAIEMFVDGDRAVVFSNVYKVEALDDGSLCQGYGGAPEPAFDVEGDYFYCGRSFVKTTVIDLAGEEHQVVRELYVDGWYTSSRRHDGIVRAVVQSQMQRPATVPYLYEVVYNAEPYPQSREAEINLAKMWALLAKEAIRETTLDQWLPVWGERIDGEVQKRAHQCADFYSPSPGMTNYGLTQILGFDMNKDTDATITSILGQATQVYANSEALVLAQADWSWFERDRTSDRTAVHRFAVSSDGARTPYQGSGFVPGMVNDQFSIDERGGVIRVATTRTTWNHEVGDQIAPEVWVPPTTDNLVTTLGLDAGALEQLGQTPGLAEGERIFSARFIGDLGYIVTFRQVDPLFAIDLSDPGSPTVLGELKIPGFSDYMHPLGDGHLLTIGRDIDEQTQFDRGTALQIFDVSDPVNPKLAHKALVGEGYSEANHNHKAFNFYADKGLLAFPFVSYEGDFASTLELWDVSVDEGFNRRGAVDHSDLVVEDCGPYPGEVDFYHYCGYHPQITRGVFIDDFIYSISHGGVRVHEVGDLGAVVATARY
jgi:hypothetical protein